MFTLYVQKNDFLKLIGKKPKHFSLKIFDMAVQIPVKISLLKGIHLDLLNNGKVQLNQGMWCLFLFFFHSSVLKYMISYYVNVRFACLLAGDTAKR